MTEPGDRAPVPRASQHLRRPRQYRGVPAPLRVARDRLPGEHAAGRERHCPRPTCTTSAAARIAIRCWSRTTCRARPAICARPSTTARRCWRCAAATSCWVDRYRGPPWGRDAGHRAGRPGDGRRRRSHDRQHHAGVRSRRRRQCARWWASRTTPGARIWAPASKPLGRVIRGRGDNGEDGGEGVRDGRVIGTYVHGPLLPKNPWLADLIITEALARRNGAVELEPLDDSLELESQRVAAARGGTVHRAQSSPRWTNGSPGRHRSRNRWIGGRRSTLPSSERGTS